MGALRGVGAAGIASARRAQAMVEALVALIILINIFMAIPLIGRLGEIKRQSVQAARYGAWERTAWWPATPNQVTVAAAKSGGALANETLYRFFGDQSVPFKATDKTAALSGMKDFTPPSQKGKLVDWSGNTPTSSNVNNRTPGLFATLMDGVLAVTSSSVLEFLLGSTFDPDINGYHTATVKVPLGSGFSLLDSGRASPVHKAILPAGTNLVMEAKNTMLVDTWNAQGPGHAEKRVRGLVLTSLLDNAVLDTVIGILGWIFPEFKDPSPNAGPFDPSIYWGHVAIDPVPCDRLPGDASCNGLYRHYK